MVCSEPWSRSRFTFTNRVIPLWIGEGLLDQLKRRAESQHLLDRFRRARSSLRRSSRRRCLCLAADAPKRFAISREGLVRLKEMPGIGIDQRDAARHVGQDFLVENDFAFDPARRLRLPPGEFSGEPGADRGQHNQPDRWNR